MMVVVMMIVVIMVIVVVMMIVVVMVIVLVIVIVVVADHTTTTVEQCDESGDGDVDGVSPSSCTDVCRWDGTMVVEGLKVGKEMSDRSPTEC